MRVNHQVLHHKVSVALEPRTLGDGFLRGYAFSLMDGELAILGLLARTCPFLGLTTAFRTALVVPWLVRISLRIQLTGFKGLKVGRFFSPLRILISSFSRAISSSCSWSRSVNCSSNTSSPLTTGVCSSSGITGICSFVFTPGNMPQMHAFCKPTCPGLLRGYGPTPFAVYPGGDSTARYYQLPLALVHHRATITPGSWPAVRPVTVSASAEKLEHRV